MGRKKYKKIKEVAEKQDNKNNGSLALFENHRLEKTLIINACQFLPFVGVVFLFWGFIRSMKELHILTEYDKEHDTDPEENRETSRFLLIFGFCCSLFLGWNIIIWDTLGKSPDFFLNIALSFMDIEDTSLMWEFFGACFYVGLHFAYIRLFFIWRNVRDFVNNELHNGEDGYFWISFLAIILYMPGFLLPFNMLLLCFNQ